jgi:MarR family transcriptional regulator for hemolysin
MSLPNLENFGILLAETARTWRHRLDQRLKPLGLSQARWVVILVLNRYGDGITQTELAERAGIEGPTLVRLLDRMAEDGWIERRVSPTDRRAKTVHLMPQAQAVTVQIKQVARKLRQELLADVPQADLLQVMQVLEGVKRRAEQL